MFDKIFERKEGGLKGIKSKIASKMHWFIVFIYEIILLQNHLSLFLTAFYWTDEVTIDSRKYPTIKKMKISHSLPIKGLFSLNVEGWWRSSLWDWSVVYIKLANPSLICAMSPSNIFSVYFLKAVITNNIWIWTLIIALPIKVAVKNFLNGIRKCPQVIPAKSNNGLGIDAQRRIVAKPYFWRLS